MDLFRKIKLKGRILILFLLILVVNVLGLVYSYISMSNAEESLRLMYENRLLGLNYLVEADRDAYQSSIAISQALHEEVYDNKLLRNKTIKEINQNYIQVKERFDKYKDLYAIDDSSEYARLSNSFEEKYDSLNNVSKRIITFLSQDDQINAKNLYFDSYPLLFATMRSNLDQLTKLSLEQSKADFEALQKAGSRLLIISYFLFAVILLVIITGMWLIFKRVIAPLKRISDTLISLSKGHLPNKFDIDRVDEIGQIKQQVNNVLEGLRKTADFARKIGEGNLGSEYQPLSKEDVLGNALLDMRQSFLENRKEEELRQQEDKKRNWATQGIAEFGELLRQSSGEIEDISAKIIKKLVQYLNANQGGLFIINDEDKSNVFLELTAAFAYDRQKFIERKIVYGEGLIGTCAIEKESIYLKEIPEDYIEIESGLGNANPRAILIVPLKLDNQIFGVVELASFNEFGDHEISFVEKIGENIAASLSSARISARTNELLEQSKLQAEEMAAKEEEMRQNMEELQATQEEMHRKQQEIEAANQKMQENEAQLMKALAEAKEREELFEQANKELKGKEQELLDQQRAIEEANNKLQNNQMVMKKALEKGRLREEEIKQKNEELQAQEEEMRQNMEELQATQEEMQRKARELEAANNKSKQNEAILKKTLEKHQKVQEELKTKNEQMLEQKEEMLRKQEELEFINKKFKTNQLVLEKAVEKAKQSQEELKKQNDELKVREEKVSKEKQELEATKAQLKTEQDKLKQYLTQIEATKKAIAALKKS